MIGAYVKGNDPRDVLICNKINNFNEISKGVKLDLVLGEETSIKKIKLKTLLY